MDLREKLRLTLAAEPVVRQGRSAVLPGAATQPPYPNLDWLPIEIRHTPLGDVYLAEERWPLRYRHGTLSLGEALDVGTEALGRLAPGVHPGHLESAAFIDIETTGLAGGTGTLAFLVGIANFEHDSACLRQYFLADIGGEEAMLSAIADHLAGCRTMVTFNGRCFDVPLLASRFVLGRLRPPFERLSHIDLLPAARRLYGRRLDSCRLSAIEEAVLGIRRGRDIPGWAVPRLYFNFLRSGDTPPLAAVFRHNRLDVLSLITLLARTGQLLADHAPADPGHCLALARWDEDQGRLTRAAKLYRSVLSCSTDADEQSIALHRLLRIERRLGDWDDMECLLLRALERDLSARFRIRLLVELAKIKEHRRHDFAFAEAVTREAIALRDVIAQRYVPSPPIGVGTDNLDLRLARLLRRRGPSLARGPARSNLACAQESPEMKEAGE